MLSKFLQSHSALSIQRKSSFCSQSLQFVWETCFVVIFVFDKPNVLYTRWYIFGEAASCYPALKWSQLHISKSFKKHLSYSSCQFFPIIDDHVYNKAAQVLSNIFCKVYSVLLVLSLTHQMRCFLCQFCQTAERPQWRGRRGHTEQTQRPETPGKRSICLEEKEKMNKRNNLL